MNEPIETEIDILLQSEFLLANHKWYSMYDFMASLVSVLYPHRDYILDHIENYGILSFLLEKANEWNTDKLEVFSNHQIYSFFLAKLKQGVSLAQVRAFSRYFVVIDSVDDNGAISFKDGWLSVFSSSWGIPKGSLFSDNVEKSKRENPSSLDENGVSIPVVSVSRKSVAKTDAERRLEKFWFKITAGNFDNRYLWRNKLSRVDYEELRNRLQECSYEQCSGFVKRFARVILLYIAEWYKRSYNGNDGKDNAIKDLKLQCRPEEIWKYAGVPNNFLYKKRNNMYLFSMYVLGGLPINYLVHKRFADIFKEIVNAYQKKEDDENLDNNVFINNYPLQESTRSQWGSLHLYFEALMRDDYPFSDQDLKEEPFSTFVINLQEWNPMRKNFNSEWIVEGNLRNKKLRRMFRLYVTPETNGERNKSISYDRLARWGVRPDCKSFGLYLCFNDNEPDELEEKSEHITFYNTYDGYFVGQMIDCYYTFKKIPTYKLAKIKLVGRFGHRFKVVHEFDIIPYLQLYETNRYSVLSTRRTGGKNYVLLPYDYKVLHPANLMVDKKYFTDNGEAYRLLENTDVVTFEDEDGERVSLLCYINSIEVSFRKYDKVFEYDNDGKFLHYYIDEFGELKMERLPLLFNLGDIKVIKYKENEEPEVLAYGSYRVEFKKEDEFYYHTWTEADGPQEGVVGLRVLAPGYQAIHKVYAIPSAYCPIHRDCYSNQIGIDDGLEIVDLAMNFHHSECQEGKEIKWYIDSNEYEYERNTRTIKLGHPEDYISLPVFRAWISKDLYKDGVLIKKYQDRRARYPISIPLVLKNHFAVRYVGEDGAYNLDLKEENLDYFDFAFTDDEKSMTKTVVHDTIVQEIEYYLCMDRTFSEQSLNIGHNGTSDYVFYYWSMCENDDPELLSCSDDNGFFALNLSSHQQESGMVFQSLEGSVCPRHYCLPQIKGRWGKFTDSLILKCVLLAIRHHVPFRCFAPIYELLKHTDSELTDLSAAILNMKSDISISERLEGLVRLSHEFYFSWPLLNRRTWKEMPDRFLKKHLGPLISLLQDDKKQEYMARLRRNAEKLFVACGHDFSEENLLALERFSKTYWAYGDEIGAHFVKFGDNRWYGYSSDGAKRLGYNDKDMVVKAVIFMRPRPLNDTIHVHRENGKNGYETKHPQIKGFTVLGNKKNSREDEVFRPIEDIVAFLKWLRSDTESFIAIERFFKQNLYEYKY